MFMFLVGLVIGCTFGMFLMAILTAGKREELLRN